MPNIKAKEVVSKGRAHMKRKYLLYKEKLTYKIENLIKEMTVSDIILYEKMRSWWACWVESANWR